MTRDEAISRVSQACFVMNTRPPEGFAESFVTALAELHGIAFVKPKTYSEKIEDALAKFTDHSSPEHVSAAFEAVGLRIIEK
jgi:hypothetical protein